MKPVICFLLLSSLVLSCKKGKTLPHDVAVQFITLTEASVYPEDYFPSSDPYEPGIYPNYVHNYSTSEIAANFNKGLVSYLNKNKVVLQSDPAAYVLKITSIHMSESLESHSYIDSCSSTNAVSYVYTSSLRFQVSASLYKNGIFLESWTREGKSWERVASKTDDCNRPKIRGIIRGPYSLIYQVAKELRVRVSKKIYELET